MSTRILTLVAVFAAVAMINAGSAVRSARADVDGKAMTVQCDGCQAKWVTTRRSYGVDYVVVYDKENVTVCQRCDVTARQYLSGDSKALTRPPCGHELTSPLVLGTS